MGLGAALVHSLHCVADAPDVGGLLAAVVVLLGFGELTGRLVPA